MKKSVNSITSRRNFLGTTARMATVSLTALASSAQLQAKPHQTLAHQEWFDKIKGKHKMVFDAVTANEGLQVIWPFTFMKSNNDTGTPDSDLTAMIVLRSKCICLAMNDKAWQKYKLGKLFKLMDPATNAPADRNLYWDPQEGEMPQEEMSIKDLQLRGALFCVCETAITLTSGQYAKSKGLNPDEVKKDWISMLLPDIHLVPSGVWALNLAQEHGCSYCYAG